MLSRQLWYLTDSLMQLEERTQVGAIGIDEGDLVGTGEHWVTRQGKETGQVHEGDLVVTGEHWVTGQVKETGQVHEGDWVGNRVQYYLLYLYLHDRAGTFASFSFHEGFL